MVPFIKIAQKFHYKIIFLLLKTLPNFIWLEILHAGYLPQTESFWKISVKMTISKNKIGGGYIILSISNYFGYLLCVCVWYFNDWKQKHKIWQGWWRCPACALCCSCFYFSREKILTNLSLQMLSRGYLDFWSHSSERPLSVLIEISACSDLDFFVVVTVWYHKDIQQDLSTLNSWSLCFGPLFILLMLYFSVQWINECCGFQC